MKNIIQKISYSLGIAIFLYFIKPEIIKSILENETISYFLITLIAGLFGFIIAVIPFTIQILSMDTNSIFIRELKKTNLINQLFNRLTELLRRMFILFIYLLILEIFISDILPFYKNIEYSSVILFVSLIFLTLQFLETLKNIVFNDIQTLVNLYLNILEKEKK